MESRVVVVAVDASKEITDYALEWVVRNVIKSSDSVFLLAVLPLQKHPPDTDGNRRQSRTSHLFSRLLQKWGLLSSKQSSSCDIMGLANGAEQDTVRKVNVVCELMMQQLFLSHNLKKVHGEVRVLADAHLNSVASMAGELGATWVVLDKHLKREANCCLKQLICNIVVIDHANPRILRSVNPQMSKKRDTHVEHSDQTVADMIGLLLAPSHRSSATSSTPTSLGMESPDYKSSPSTTNEQLNSSSVHLNSQYFPRGSRKLENYIPSPLKGKPQSPSKGLSFHFSQQPQQAPGGSLGGKRRNYSGPLRTATDTRKGSLAALYALPAPARRSVDSTRLLWPMTLRSKLPNEINPIRDSPTSLNNGAPEVHASPTIRRTSSIRRAMELSTRDPPTPPPLCSVCRHSAPHFGKAPRKFRYEEMETATNQFAVENLLGEGGFGFVYRGVLSDGQVIAVKRRKFLSAQGASEFCSEVEILSCAQHKNLVMLVGYCIEIEWLLVYEFVCNGSLDKHLYGKVTGEVMAWHNRMKTARGAARGLRYLHEDCRVGCIIHRDFRPNNILLTHDFEPMVGDFGLARWQADGQLAEETRIVSAFGYLAPEYIQSGLITEKADVYAYGVVLLELLSGYKATEFSRNTGKQFVSEWGLPLLQGGMIEELIDPRLVNDYVHKQVKSVMHAAELCLSPVPDQRPRMSQVLKILDGDMPSNMVNGYRQQFLNHANENMDRNTSSHLTQLMSYMSPSPATTREPRKNSKEFRGNSAFVRDGYQEERDGCYALEQSESLVDEEYQAYLQGSLAKFIQNMDIN